MFSTNNLLYKQFMKFQALVFHTPLDLSDWKRKTWNKEKSSEELFALEHFYSKTQCYITPLFMTGQPLE